MDDTSRIPTNLRTLLILEAIGRQTEPMTPAEIGRKIGLPKQTTHRLCNTLLDEGFLARDERGRGMRPGRRARLLGAGVMHSSSSHVTRHQVLQDLATEIGETVNFVVPEDRGMAYQDRVETDWPFRIQLPVGTNVPFHCTASGKTYLASLPKAERRRLVNVMHLEQHTPSTITDPDLLLAELQDIAKRGFALDNCEFYEGMVAVAVPVMDPTGRYCAAVAFHAPEQRISAEMALTKVDTLQRTSHQLTATIFGD
ncbi:MAG: IclR family transcriptional regulator [Pseudomonadota bacterium]